MATDDLEIKCGCGWVFHADAETFQGNQMLDEDAVFGLYLCPWCKSSRSGPARIQERLVLEGCEFAAVTVAPFIDDLESCEYVAPHRVCGDVLIGHPLEDCETCGGLRMRGKQHAYQSVKQAS